MSIRRRVGRFRSRQIAKKRIALDYRKGLLLFLRISATHRDTTCLLSTKATASSQTRTLVVRAVRTRLQRNTSVRATSVQGEAEKSASSDGGSPTDPIGGRLFPFPLVLIRLPRVFTMVVDNVANGSRLSFDFYLRKSRSSAGSSSEHRFALTILSYPFGKRDFFHLGHLIY